MDLIYVTKPGEPALDIHPDALKQHQKLGWKVSERPAAAEAVEPKPESAPRPAGAGAGANGDGAKGAK